MPNQLVNGKITKGNVHVEGIEGVQVKGVQAEGVEDAMFNPLSLGTESNVNNIVDEENLVNVPSD